MRGPQQRVGLILTMAMAGAIFGPLRLGCQEVSPRALYDQAGGALDAGNTALAIKLYQELLRRAPDSIEARTNLGVAFAQEGRYDEAVQQYRQVLSRDSRNESAMLNLALAYYKHADRAKARKELDGLHRSEEHTS